MSYLLKKEKRADVKNLKKAVMQNVFSFTLGTKMHISIIIYYI